MYDAPALTGFYQNWHDLFAGFPVLGTLFDGAPISGRSFMTAGLILAIMVTPIVTSIARETFATVPQSAKDAAHALGATRWEMIRASVFPHSRSGLVAGILIGLGRALGETIAAALVIGASPHITAKLFSSGYSLPSVIANDFGEATGDWRSALIGMGVIVFILTFLIGIVARVYVARADRHSRGQSPALDIGCPRRAEGGNRRRTADSRHRCTAASTDRSHARTAALDR